MKISEYLDDATAVLDDDEETDERFPDSVSGRIDSPLDRALDSIIPMARGKSIGTWQLPEQQITFPAIVRNRRR